VLIEAADRVLPGMPDRISKATHRLLDETGVAGRTGITVTEADGGRAQYLFVDVRRGELPPFG
jgi:NADH dehydrogenase FAD-containing subunit